MAFGADYKAETFSNAVKLDDGYYMAKIVSTEGIERPDGSKYIKVVTEVNNNPNAYPNMFFINDSPTKASGSLTLEATKSMWNKKMTAFFDGFKIERGNFDFRKWVGKEGEVTIQQTYNKPEYSEVVPYKTKIRERKPVNPDFSNIGTVVSNTSADANTDNTFHEDMPF